ncbi:FtsK/SpoIIIE domain-containing protein [Agromyces larvae]|uniref:FtsK domain-containing protein n=1 Tax=Agromyces larvae TaxID=2929802 RepID=A0ABY4C2G3_9MICO|nr:FtsK/SpoIIIE domain-containing protein [Agromyces larvae]UOE44627.1 hypothetical protein MTO99_02200 [Agromyces larvae]
MPRRRAHSNADAATPAALSAVPRAAGTLATVPSLAAEPVLSLPAPVPEAPRAGFPVLATLAPIGGAGVLWALTGSTFALVFAALGPLAAVASLLDGRRQRRRTLRRAALERATAFAELDERVRAGHDAERAEAWRRAGSARTVLAAPPGSDWRHRDAGSAVLGRAAGRSALRLDGTPSDDLDRAALARAAICDDLPLAAPVGDGIGFVGPIALARSAARAALVQAAHRAAPGAVTVDLPRDGWSWARALPHRRGDRRILVVDAASHGAGAAGVGATLGATLGAGGGDAGCIAVAPTEAGLPPGLATVLRLESPTAAVLVRHAGFADHRPVVPHLVSEREAAEWARAVGRAAATAASPAEPPQSVHWGSLPQPAGELDGRARLRAVVGRSADDTVELDLVADGPHALVAGTTGSGKSEFLLAWVAALAAAYPPEAVAFLLVDFKGGAAFAPLIGLPHVTGVVTDLDESEARRAVASLRAELRHREQVLTTAGARDLTSLGATTTLPRLVVVVDEYQAMIERFPALGEVIADLAARGRSLGVHLVLAAQRPNGVVREAITANCPLRISLRVLAAADSTAVIGSDLAARLPAEVPGRAVLVRGDGRPTPFQSALADAAALERLHLRRAGAAPARRPWLAPLPHRLPADHPELVAVRRSADGSVVFGLADDPGRQRRVAAGWHPDRDGNLLVVGAPGSGRTGALDAVADAWRRDRPGGEVVVLGGPRSRQWDTLRSELDAARSGGGADRLLVIDDLDLRFRAWPEPYRLEAADLVESLTREGRGGGLAVAASARSANAAGRAGLDGFGQVLRLRHASRMELVQAGGVGDLWNDADPAGAGQWRGLRVQVVEASPSRRHDPIPGEGAPALTAADLLAPGARGVAVVSTVPRADGPAVAALLGADPLVFDARPDAARAAEAALAAAPAAGEPGERVVLAADAESWAGAWAVAAAVREAGVVVVRGGPAEYRALARDRGLPPLLDERPPQCWVLRPGEAPARRSWPTTVSTSAVQVRARTTETVENRRFEMRIPSKDSSEGNESAMNA